MLCSLKIVAHVLLYQKTMSFKGVRPFLLFIFLASTMGCAGGAGIPGGGATDDGGAGSEDPKLPDSPGSSTPPISFPIPSAKGNASALVAYGCDSGSACPVTGTSDAAKVAFTQDSTLIGQYKQKFNYMLATASPKPPLPIPLPPLLKNILSPFIPSVNAEDFGPNIEAANAADANAVPLCERPGIFCADVVNGEFEAFPLGTNDSTFYYVATDGVQALGDEKQISPNKQLLYFMDQPQALTQGNTTQASENIGEKKSAYASAGGYGKQVDFVKEDGADPRIMVVGNYRERYNGFEAGNEIAFDAVNNLMSTDFLDGVGVLPLQDNIFVDVGALASVDGTESYKHLKYTWDNSLRFITTPQANIDMAEFPVRIFSVLHQVNNLGLLPRANQQVSVNIDFAPVNNYSNTLVYDVDSHGCGLLIFEDADENKRIKMACAPQEVNFVRMDQLYPEFGSDQPLQGVNENTRFDDLIIYDESSDNANIIQGKALLVDSGNHQLWQISYHNPQQRLRARDPAWIHADLIDANSIPMGAALKSFTITPDRKYLFAVNEDEDKVVAFKLKDENNKALDIATIRNSKTDVTIKDKINWNPDNEGKIQPNALTIQKVDDTHEYLVVGSQALKGSVWFDLKPIKDQVTAKVQPAPAPSPVVKAPVVDCAALKTQLLQTKDASTYSTLKAQYLAAGCK